MRTEDLKYLLVLSQKQSINKAAEELKITHQSLGKAISNIEMELEAKLFERTSRGIKLTREGQRVVDFAKKMTQEYEKLKDTLKNNILPKDIAGEINIYSSAVFHISVFPHLINVFKKIYPQVKTKSYTLPKNEIIKQIKDDREKNLTSIGFISLENQQKKEYNQQLAKNGLEFYSITTSELCFFVNKNHELADKDEIPLKTILSYPLIKLSKNPSGIICQFQRYGMYKAEIDTPSYSVWHEVLKNSDKVGFLYDVVLSKNSIFYKNVDDLAIIHSKEHILAEIGYILPKNLSDQIAIDFAKCICNEIR